MVATYCKDMWFMGDNLQMCESFYTGSKRLRDMHFDRIRTVAFSGSGHDDAGAQPAGEIG